MNKETHTLQFVIHFYIELIKLHVTIEASTEELALSYFWNSVQAGNNGDVSKYKIIDLNTITNG